ncbi:processed acidic surface protein [Geobacillus thermodenitrificans]|uniref:Processed acidic surface protein n=1 Tax=Geobacillus thermodenitrificans TaxID=33940 RepID=A0ABY9QD34_GEOTD|nr:processed acidic surface protein [Geobacillus thermodenitrificans]WMV75992.1 processed acidic surface protein [Geobacillus thermodenitrificans]
MYASSNGRGKTMVKKWIIMAVFAVMLALSPVSAAAAISRAELEQYVESVGWTVSDLLTYLDRYGLTVADFRTMEELKQWLGTPLNEERLHAVLHQHGLTVEELDALLGQFGETVQEYTFVEDLDAAIRFYSQHNDAMQQMNDLLGALGMTEKEVNKLARHIASLGNLQLSEQLTTLRERLRPFKETEGPWTKEARRKLQAIWNEALDLLQLEAKFYVDGQETGFSAATASAGAKPIVVKVYNRQGEEIVDIAVTREMLSSGYIVRAGEKGIEAGLLALKMKRMMYGEKLPDTASPYLMHALAGLLLMFAGFFLYRRVGRLKG